MHSASAQWHLPVGQPTANGRNYDLAKPEEPSHMSRGRGNLAARKGAMRSEYFLASERLGFRAWRKQDLPLAMELWTDVRVTGLFGGPYTPDRVCVRLEREMETQLEFGMQYWPIFLLADGRHVGVCGLQPWRIEEKIPELAPEAGILGAGIGGGSRQGGDRVWVRA